MGEDEFDFDSKQVLDLLHNSFRFRGGNEFVLPVDPNDFVEDNVDLDPQTLLNSEEGEYYTGAFTASIILLVFWVLWCISLPFARCACKAKKGNCLRLVVFFTTLNISILGWFLSLTGYGYLSNGIDEGTNNADTISLDLSDFIVELDAAIALGPELDQLKVNLSICDAAIAEAGANIDFNDIPGSEELEILEQPRQEVDGIPEDINELVDLMNDNSGTVKGIYEGIISSVIVFLVFFNVSTIIGFFCRDKEGCIASFNKGLNKIGCIVMFSLGLVFVGAVVIILCFFAPIATVGSDACTPDFTETVTRQVELVVNGSVADFCDLVDFDSLTQEEQVGWFVCHYSECRPTNNIFFETAGISLDAEGNFASIEVLDDISAEVDIAVNLAAIAVAANLTDAEACQVQVTRGVEIRDQLAAFVENAVNLASCNTVTPLLTSAINDSGCNGIIAGVGVIFITWTLAITALMVALCAYIQLDFELGTDTNYEKEDGYDFAIAEEVDNPRFNSTKF